MSKVETDVVLAKDMSKGRKATLHHRTHQKTSFLLVLILPFFLFGLMGALPNGYEGIMQWIGSPFGALTLLAFISIGLFQSNHSIADIVIDYVDNQPKCDAIVKIIKLICFLLWVLGAAAIVKMWLLS